MRRPGTHNTSGTPLFFGWKVVAAAFLLAAFTWGIGFYGPPVYMAAIEQTRGWSATLVSAAFTCNMLCGALLMANLATLHRRFGIPSVTAAGAICTALGLLGWAFAAQPWELFAITPVSGAGWAMTSGAALNAIVAPWFDRRRPAAIAAVYNGSIVGGIVFAPLWVELIRRYGFPAAAGMMGATTVLTVGFLARRYFTPRPADLGLAADGAPVEAAPPRADTPPPLTTLRDWRLVTLTAATALTLFAQIGLVMQLYPILASAFGPHAAGATMSLMTLAAFAGRAGPALMTRMQANWRIVAAQNGAVQLAGIAILWHATGHAVAPLLIGTLLFGFGIGNATSLPPLIAQAEFAPDDVPRAVSLTFGISQAVFAFAPLAFGALRDGGTQGLFSAAAIMQLTGIIILLTGMLHRRIFIV